MVARIKEIKKLVEDRRKLSELERQTQEEFRKICACAMKSK